MKLKLKSRVITGLCIIALLVSNSFQSFAIGLQNSSEVSFNGRYEGGFTVEAQDQNLFFGMKNLLPGAVVENTVKITNNTSQNLTFYVKAYPDYTAAGDGAKRDNGPVVTEEGKKFRDDLLDIMKMNITTENGRYIYGDENFSLPASAKGTKFETEDYGITIGSIPARSSETLVVTVKLPGKEMGNAFADTFDAVDWVFYVEGTDSSGGDSHGGGGGGSHTGGDGGEATGPGMITTITDPEVPLSPGIGDPGDVNITIEDGAIPLDALAKTGDSALYLKQAGIILAILVIAVFAVGYARKKRRN